MHEIESRALRAYQETFGGEPELLASAPGRVNLIGEHTDYNGGFVLPCAIDRRVAVAMSRGGDTVYSADFEEAEPATGSKRGSWGDYPRGVLWSLAESGHRVDGMTGAYAGNVPQGSGLSSSAAIESATALAVDELLGLGIARKELALVCQRAENAYVGVNSGIMDQYASLLCEAGAALFIDCRTLDATTVPLDLEAAGLSLVVCDTRVERSLAATGYNERRAMCELAAEEIGVVELRDATLGDLDTLHGIIKRRARHVITENLRVLQAVEALSGDDFATFGKLMYASHLSLRDDYEVSVPELDVFVETAMASGALGARLTGAGFGGCAIALIETGSVSPMESKVREAYTTGDMEEPVFYTFHPSSGAEVAR
jgi:galactokinase